MQDKDKTEEQRSGELKMLDERVAESERVEGEHQRVQEALRESESRYRDLYLNAPNAYFCVGPVDGSILRCNNAALRLLGYDRERMIGMRVFDLYANTPHGMPKAQEVFKSFKAGESIRDIELQMKHRDGNSIWVSLSVEPVRDGHGNIIESRSMVIDISERKRAEETLRNERDKAQKYLDVAEVIFVVIDADQKVTMINKKGCEVLGYKQKEIIGKNWFNTFVPERIRDETKAVFDKLISGKLRQVEYFENPVLTKSGEEKDIAWHNTTLRDESGNVIGTLSSGGDITERKRLQEQLLWSQKMETVGRLAGGVAHDFNNLLTTITGYAELGMRELDPADRLHRNLQEILRAADRAAELTRQLLAFSRRQITEPKVINLNDVLLDMGRMLRRLIGEDIELATLPAEGLGRVKADLGQMEQLIVNLSVNARDAMPGGGKLTLETANVTLDEGYASRHVAITPGRYVMLAVSDTGVGMTEEVKRHLFEPFFTTKKVGKGTGLGLATCYGIVKQSGGNIWVYSELGHGTTFKIYLPQVKGEAEVPPKQDESGSLPRGTETVLLVEDEPSVRGLSARMLREQGYTVLEAATGEEALRVAREQGGEEIRLLLTDMVMPQMGGKELADRLTADRPEIKVLFFSGYTDNAVVHHGVLDPGVAFLQKPFSTAALARRVRELLGR